MKPSDAKMDRRKAAEREIKRQKQMEMWDTRQFLEFIGYRVTAIRGREKPDTIAYVSKNGVNQKIGIEHTSYLVDAEPGKASTGMQFEKVWRLIQSSIRRRTSHLPQLNHVSGWVLFKRDNPPPEEYAHDLARELVQLAREFPVGPDEERTFKNIRGHEHLAPMLVDLPDRYPLLRQYADKVNVHGTGCAERLHWSCFNTSASFVGLSRQTIAHIIEEKNRKSAKYDWGNVDERWLLIAAPGYPIVKTAGPHPEFFEWDCPEIKSACQSPGFDRIYFWERHYCWCKEIYPGAPIEN